MPKVTLDDLTNLQNETSAVNTINNNSAAIEAAIENTLSRDGTSPNEMNANLDMNNYRVFNLPAATTPTEPVRKEEFDNLTVDISNADQYAQEAKDARDAAQVAEAGALQAETFAYLWASENEDTPVDDGTRTGYSSFHWSAKSEDHASDSENAKIEAQTARDFAHAWATEAEDVPVDDGVNPSGFSAYHWAQKAEDAVAGNLNASSINYDNTVSGLTATNVQDAIDEADSRFLRFDDEQTLTPEQQEQAFANLGIDPWATLPLRVPIPVFDHLGGGAPPTDKWYRYVKLSAGETGSGGYNEGILTSESVSGSAPYITATAVVSLPDSPLDGQTIPLINTEQRFLRAGTSSGVAQDDEIKQHTHGVNDPGHYHGQQTDGGAGSAGSQAPGNGNWQGGNKNTNYATTDITIQSTGGAETRPRNISATYYMRIL